MKPFLRGKAYYVKLRTRDGDWVQLATGTRDKRVAEAYGALLDRLGLRGTQEWDLLDALCAKPPKLTLSALYAAQRDGSLVALRAKLDDVDLEPWVARFVDARRTEIQPDTLDHYRVHIRHFIPDEIAFARSKYTTAFVRAGLDALTCSAATKRKYRAALLAFGKFLQQHEILTDDPAARVKVGGRIVVRDSFIDRAQLLQVLVAMPEPYRSLAAILHATGSDMSQLLGVTLRGVDTEHRKLMLDHGKTFYRRRAVLVQDWAWQYVLDSIARARAVSDDPTTKLFPGVNRYTLSDKFRVACKAVGITNYMLRDARHSYAVSVLRAGGSAQAVAQQLGHANTVLVNRVYGRYMATDAEVQEAHRKVERRERQSRNERSARRGSA